MSNFGGDISLYLVFLLEIKLWQKQLKTCKIRYQTFLVLSNFAIFLCFAPNIRWIVNCVFLSTWFIIMFHKRWFCFKTASCFGFGSDSSVFLPTLLTSYLNWKLPLRSLISISKKSIFLTIDWIIISVHLLSFLTDCIFSFSKSPEDA